MNRGSRGQSPARGRGRGNGRGGRGRGRGRGRGGSQVIESEMFYDTYGSGSSTPRKWGTKPKRGLGSPSGPVDFGYGRGAGFRGRGRGNTLTSEDRPLLRPITFVPSTAPILFQEEEEILKPIVEEVDDKEESHVPTANTVLRVFSHRPARFVDSDFNNTDAEEIEEVDFHDLSAFQEKVHKEIASTKDAEVPHEEKFTGIFVAQATREVRMSEPAPIDPPTEAIEAHEDTPPLSPPESFPGEVQAMVTETLVPEAAAIALRSQEIAHEDIVPGNNAEEPHEENSTGIFVVQEAREVVMSEPAPVDPHPTQTNDEVVDASPASPRASSPREVEAMVTEPTVPETAVLPPPSPPPETAEDDSEPSFFFDSTPAPISLSQSSGINIRPLGVADDDDVIVYEAPLPRSRASTPAQHNFPSTFTFTPSPTKLARLPHPGRSAVKNKLLDRRRKRKATTTSSFADRAAAVAEAQLYGDDKRDGRYDERRRDDSDVEWGDSDGEGVIDNDGAEGMDVDPELELDSEAMKRFAKGLGGPWKTMDDIADEERMKLEDEEDENDSGSSSSTGDDSDDEEDALRAIEQEENEMMGDSDEEIYSPDTSFQMRLEALRLGSKAGKSKAEDEDSDGDDDDEFELNRSWADQDDDFIAHIQDVVDRDGGEDRQLKRIFQAMQNGTFNESDEEWTKPARRKKDKWKDLPPSLQSQWESDRKKKADRKRERELEKLIQAADPMEKKKGGKKGRNAMLAVAGLDPTIQVIPNRIIDPTTLVQQIKRFIANIGGPLTMSLPPTNKQTRKHVHELAMAFGLKSVSKGKGDSRYTTLTKSSRTGQGVDERKVSKVMRIMGARGGSGGEWGDWAGSKGGKSSGGGGGGGRMPHHKEGEEVGKAAPKIGQANIGFRMLASMGWAEGTHIGVAEDRALKDPLTAVIKNTKLGLGATK